MHKTVSLLLLLVLLSGTRSAFAQTAPYVRAEAAQIPQATAPSDEPTVSASSAVAVVHAGADGFELADPNESFALQLRGDVQADGRFFAESDVPEGDESFYLRRVRIVFQGTVFDRFDFKVMPNFGLGRAELQDAYLDARFSPFVAVRAGKFKVPVGLELLQSPTNMAFENLILTRMQIAF